MLPALWSCFAQRGREQNNLTFKKNAFFRKKIGFYSFPNKCHLVALMITLHFELLICLSISSDVLDQLTLSASPGMPW